MHAASRVVADERRAATTDTRPLAGLAWSSGFGLGSEQIDGSAGRSIDCISPRSTQAMHLIDRWIDGRAAWLPRCMQLRRSQQTRPGRIERCIV